MIFLDVVAEPVGNVSYIIPLVLIIGILIVCGIFWLVKFLKNRKNK